MDQLRTILGFKVSVSGKYPLSLLHKLIAGRYWPVRIADRPITARCRFM